MELHPCPEEFKKAGEVRPVVVLFGWLLAKSRHLHKYGELYHHYGADVITVKLEVMEVSSERIPVFLAPSAAPRSGPRGQSFPEAYEIALRVRFLCVKR